MYMQDITVKSILSLFIGCGFSKCEVWKESDYIEVHRKKKLRCYRIASAKINDLQKIGFSSVDAQRLVIMEGTQKINKTNLSLLGNPIAKGSAEELSNYTELWDCIVTNIEIKGFARKKLIIRIIG